MPFFKSTYNILKRPDDDEVYNENWMDSDKLVLPPCIAWDYQRELNIDDVDIWEVIYEQSGGIGVYAAWLPYAEFYMITAGWKDLQIGDYVNDRIIETYYGNGSLDCVKKRAKDLNIPLPSNHYWVNDDEMWLYKK